MVADPIYNKKQELLNWDIFTLYRRKQEFREIVKKVI